jgi:hypothetical protein
VFYLNRQGMIRRNARLFKTGLAYFWTGDALSWCRVSRWRAASSEVRAILPPPLILICLLIDKSNAFGRRQQEVDGSVRLFVIAVELGNRFVVFRGKGDSSDREERRHAIFPGDDPLRSRSCRMRK